MKVKSEGENRVMTEACYMGRHERCGGTTTCIAAKFVPTPCECVCHAPQKSPR